MKRKSVSRFLMLSVFVVLASACSKKTEYTNVIPVDATSVVVIDVQSINNKAGLNDAENEGLKLKVIDALKSGLSAASLMHVEKVLKDPEESGLSVKDALYAFGSPSFVSPVFVWKVNDADKLRNTLNIMVNEQISQPVTDVDGYSYAMVAGGMIMAYNESALLVTQAGSSAQQDMIGRLLRNENDNNVTNNNYFQKMRNTKGDVVFYTSMQEMPRSIARRMNMPDDMNLKDMVIVGNLNFENGRIVTQFEPFTENEQLKAIIDNQSKFMGSINANLLGDFPEASLAFMSVNINGEELYKMLRENEDFRNRFSVAQAAQFRDFFQSFKGDVSAALLNVTMNSMPTFVVYAESDEEAALNALYEQRGKLGMARGEDIMKLAPNEYVYRSRNLNVFFGIKNKHLYATNDELIYQGIGMNTDRSMKNSRYASNIKGKTHFFALDLEAIAQLPVVKMAVAFGGSEYSTYYDVLSRFSYLEATGNNNGQTEISLYMRDKDKNALKQIIDVARQYVGI